MKEALWYFRYRYLWIAKRTTLTAIVLVAALYLAFKLIPEANPPAYLSLTPIIPYYLIWLRSELARTPLHNKKSYERAATVSAILLNFITIAGPVLLYHMISKES